MIFRSRRSAGGSRSCRGKVNIRKVTIARDDGNFVEWARASRGRPLALNISSQIANGDLVKVNQAEPETAPTSRPAKAQAASTAPQPTTAQR